MATIGIVPHVTGVGGVRSFMDKFRQGAAAQGVKTTFDLDAPQLDAVLVLAGTKRLTALRRLRRRGVRVVQRLDGINWIQRRGWAGWRYTLRAEYGNWNLAFIRRHLADRVVYQSEFVRGWWERDFGLLDKPATVIHNGVDLRRYTPEGPHDRPREGYRLLVVEGSLGGVLSFGLDWAVQVTDELAAQGWPVQLTVAGRVDEAARVRALRRCRAPVEFRGVLPGEAIPQLDRSAHLFLSAELNSACPNAVIEALACGTPVAGFATGALAELLGPEAGRAVPYGGDVWRLEPADVPALTAAAAEILSDWTRWHVGARRHAEAHFALETMVRRYLEFLLG